MSLDLEEYLRTRFGTGDRAHTLRKPSLRKPPYYFVPSGRIGHFIDWLSYCIFRLVSV